MLLSKPSVQQLHSFPSQGAPTSITTDASNTDTGAVLQQYVEGGWKPLAFFSKKLNYAEQYYSRLDRELKTVYKAI